MRQTGRASIRTSFRLVCALVSGLSGLAVAAEPLVPSHGAFAAHSEGPFPPSHVRRYKAHLISEAGEDEKADLSSADQRPLTYNDLPHGPEMERDLERGRKMVQEFLERNRKASPDRQSFESMESLPGAE